MPIRMRKLNQGEAATAFPRRGQMDLSEYVDALATLQPGDAAAMELGDLTTRAAKRRLGQAANQLGHRLRWARATDTLVVCFQVVSSARARTQKPAVSAAVSKSRRAGAGRASRVAAQPAEQVQTVVPENPPERPRRGRRRKALG